MAVTADGNTELMMHMLSKWKSGSGASKEEHLAGVGPSNFAMD